MARFLLLANQLGQGGEEAMVCGWVATAVGLGEGGGGGNGIVGMGERRKKWVG